MKAFTIQNADKRAVSDLEVNNIPLPIINENEVLVKVKAVGLNPVDYKLVKSHNSKWIYPHVLGLDAAGEVVEIGENNPNNFQKGERVLFHSDLTKDGVFAEYAKASNNVIGRIPDNVAYEDAASVLCNGMTAYQAIERKMNLNGKNTILIHAGAGGVGSIAIQLAKLHGLTVITTVSEHKKQWVKNLGADYIIDYKSENVDMRINEITHGNGVDVIIDSVSSSEENKDLHRLAYNGGLITIVGQPDLDNYDLGAKGQSVLSVNLGGVHQSGYRNQQNDLAVMANELVKLFGAGKLTTIVNKIISFENIPDGLSDLQEGHVEGKIIATL
ncbi:zinc-binding dehydrogenase [Companilactobacillus mishanensis]|uniref:Zinc-binding dehydrogenase n=1 Tax=Companilactobacillus mishanensis TaxID=2486008 RepID=A0A5P0ZHA8_9LACO|nr:zinc-binding dehydrogenase [Companilactobacillus mishanensis]MQS52443.1 zinc-binding dehydrogenase [Companilactobacillus mishanensis]